MFDVDVVLEGSRGRPTLLLALSVIRPVCAPVIFFLMADTVVVALALVVETFASDTITGTLVFAATILNRNSDPIA